MLNQLFSRARIPCLVNNLHKHSVANPPHAETSLSHFQELTWLLPVRTAVVRICEGIQSLLLHLLPPSRRFVGGVQFLETLVLTPLTLEETIIIRNLYGFMRDVRRKQRICRGKRFAMRIIAGVDAAIYNTSSRPHVHARWHRTGPFWLSPRVLASYIRCMLKKCTYL